MTPKKISITHQFTTMRLPIYQLNSFTKRPFSGNPAAVCILDFWIPDATLQGIAKDNNLSETAFVVFEPEGMRIRWFTPGTEVTLCGHATLAAAKVCFEKNPAIKTITFDSLSGPLTVTLNKDQSLTLDFPSRRGKECSAPEGLTEALGINIISCHRSVDDYLVIVHDGDAVKNVSPDFEKLKTVEARGVIVSASIENHPNVDFVSRFFAPRAGVNEDPVTGSAHCVSTPYWAEKLNKTTLFAEQWSQRGGELSCEMTADNRVKLTGFCQPYLEGEIEIQL